MKKSMFAIFIISFFAIFSCSNNPVAPWGGPVDVSDPTSTQKLVFIHHSTGYNWLETGYGGLGTALTGANFFTTDAYYGWQSADIPAECSAPIGDHTDTFDWPCWFNDTVMPDVYSNTITYAYISTISDPGGDSDIIVFKSCFPNSEVGDDITDEQTLYNSLVMYFASHTDKMFVLIIPPPEQEIAYPAKTRELSNWLADRENGWLEGYPFTNVYAFDYYNVLTHPDNHHHISDGYEYHEVVNSQNTLYYDNSGDDHPSVAGQQKATAEFVPLLKAWWHQWKGY